MPELKKFIEGFGLQSGIILGDYRLIDIKGKHETIERYHQYRYPIRLRFSPLNSNAHPLNLIRDFRELTAKDKVIDSRYGNPYLCNFGNPKIVGTIGNDIIIQTIGHSQRDESST